MRPKAARSKGIPLERLDKVALTANSLRSFAVRDNREESMEFNRDKLLASYEKGVYKFTEKFENDFKKKSALTETDVLKIMLWKLSRFPNYADEPIDDNIVSIFNQLKTIKSITKENEDFCKDKIKTLLEVKGFQLPMVSTILFFINPEVFQIIDKRTNRIVMGGDERAYSFDFNNNSVDYYFEYLEKLREISRHDFNKAGKIFYQLDKEYSKERGYKLKDKPNPGEIKKIIQQYLEANK